MIDNATRESVIRWATEQYPIPWDETIDRRTFPVDILAQIDAGLSAFEDLETELSD